MTPRDIAIFLFKWKWNILGTFLFTVLVTTLTVYVVPPSYDSSAKILVERNLPPVLRTLPGPAMDLAEALNTESEILLSRTVMTAVVDRLRPEDRPKHETTMSRIVGSVRDTLQSMGLSNPVDPREYWIESLQRRIRVKPTIDASILKVSYSDEDPEWAARIINTTLDAYIENHVRVFSVERTSELYKSQVDMIGKQLAEKREEIIQYKRRMSISAMEDTRRELVRQVGNLGDEIATTQSELGALLLRYEYGHAEVKLKRAKLDSLRERREAARRRLGQLEADQEHLDALQANISSLQDSLRDYTKRYEDARLNETASAATVNVSAVDRATVASRPNHSRLFYIAISLLAGLPLAVLVAAIREYFDQRLVSSAHIEEVLTIPHLGTVAELPRAVLRMPALRRNRGASP
ncbi:MAG: hypothetical protein GC151_18905 [Betaproteobacteria bacterium]|nr:hypothetical protein [Betaproteobacteria bacterium]